MSNVYEAAQEAAHQRALAKQDKTISEQKQLIEALKRQLFVKKSQNVTSGSEYTNDESEGSAFTEEEMKGRSNLSRRAGRTNARGYNTKRNTTTLKVEAEVVELKAQVVNLTSDKLILEDKIAELEASLKNKNIAQELTTVTTLAQDAPALQALVSELAKANPHGLHNLSAAVKLETIKVTQHGSLTADFESLAYNKQVFKLYI